MSDAKRSERDITNQVQIDGPFICTRNWEHHPLSPLLKGDKIKDVFVGLGVPPNVVIMPGYRYRRAGHVYLGIITPSITWMTPLEHTMSVLMIMASSTMTFPSFTTTVIDLPLTVMMVSISTTSSAISFLAAT